MAHYAFLDSKNIVTEVIVGRDEDDLLEGVTSWEDYYGAFRGQRCKRTSYNSRYGVYLDPETNEPHEDQTKLFRWTYAGIGFEYLDGEDIFRPPSPFPSWTWENNEWVAPVPYPKGGAFVWDEETQSWATVDPNGEQGDD